ncbi:MAG: hypothetical protein JNK05_04645 [Myxococcales bacterium]|nr:hypothetical protein [Myxococcales bacterium]
MSTVTTVTKMSNEHPSDEALFDGDRAALDHARTCEECRVRSVRLRTGAALVQRVRKTSQPDLDWAKVDDFVARAAAETAADVRSGKIRPPSALRRNAPAAIGLSLAIAAAAVIGWRMQTRASNSPGPNVASTHTPSPRTSSGGTRIVDVAPAPWSEVRVILATRDVEHLSAAGERSPLTARSRVHTGDRIVGSTTRSRAVVAASTGQRLDARGESEVRIASLDASGSGAQLVRGEARVDVRRGSAKLTLDAFEWRVVAKSGSFVAKIEGDSVRLRVIEGTVDVAHRGGAPTVLTSGRELVLDKHGQQTAVQSAGAADDHALDERALALGEDGALVALPSGAESAQLTIDGASAPQGTSVVRVSRAASLVARNGDAQWTLELDPRRAAAVEPQWSSHAPTISSGTTPASAATSHGLVAANARRPARASQRVALTASTIPEDAVAGFRAVQRSLGQRARHCFDACERNNSCGDTSALAPVVDFDAEGRVGAIRIEGAPSPTLAACIDREVRAMRLPLLANQRVNLGRFSR